MVQGECGAGRWGAVWCRARVVQSMVQNKIQGVVCRASVVQGMVQGARGVRAGAVQCVVQENLVQLHRAGGWCMRVWFRAVWYRTASDLNKPNDHTGC